MNHSENYDNKADLRFFTKFDTDSINHPIEKVGKVLRINMKNMKKLN